MSIKKIEERVVEQHTSIICLVFLNLIFFGAILNMNVILMNDGRMPVLANRVNNLDTHFPFSDFDSVTFPYLADIINLDIGKYYYNLSIGDLFVYLSSISVVIYLIVYKIRKKKLVSEVKVVN
ncbi:MAG: DUF5317 domain-containing protein [Nanoarchaeota archaeon]|nr:DUF5317 domain-containing protein [Nanoarchaeota archaeon]MBU1027934.1 DUF5317 domain-containing protein [Nanoarchaeota archaeon]